SATPWMAGLHPGARRGAAAVARPARTGSLAGPPHPSALPAATDDRHRGRRTPLPALAGSGCPAGDHDWSWRGRAGGVRARPMGWPRGKRRDSGRGWWLLALAVASGTAYLTRPVADR